MAIKLKQKVNKPRELVGFYNESSNCVIVGANSRSGLINSGSTAAKLLSSHSHLVPIYKGDKVTIKF